VCTTHETERATEKAANAKEQMKTKTYLSAFCESLRGERRKE
jgi:hypothetical protein